MAAGRGIRLGILPCALQPVILATINSRCTLATGRFLSTASGSPSHSYSPPPKPAFGTSVVSFLPGPSNIPGAAPIPTNSKYSPAHIDAFFARIPGASVVGGGAEFLFASEKFGTLPRNKLVPEICLIGRSNVGKSTLVNAITGVPPSKAGKVTQGNAKLGGENGVAITSKKAGCTTTLNAYGIGPPCEKPRSTPEEPDEEIPAVGGRGRREVREARKARQKAVKRQKSLGLDKHSMILVDMPGHGHKSRKEWGAEIGKYLEKREMLRGAVVLVDAAVGLKGTDREVLRWLRDKKVRTVVVLTKGDKVLPTGRTNSTALNGAPVFAHSKTEAMLLSRCQEIWEELRVVEREGASRGMWVEGDGWESEIFITSAGATNSRAYGVSGARLAIARLAGLEEELMPLPDEQESAPARQPPLVEIVPFDQIPEQSPSAPA